MFSSLTIVLGQHRIFSPFEIRQKTKQVNKASEEMTQMGTVQQILTNL